MCVCKNLNGVICVLFRWILLRVVGFATYIKIINSFNRPYFRTSQMGGLNAVESLIKKNLCSMLYNERQQSIL